MLILPVNSTGVSAAVLAVDPQTGLPRPGLAVTDVSAHYMPIGGTSVNVALTPLAAPDAAHQPGGFIELGPADFTGWYRFDCPDEAFAPNAAFVLFAIQSQIALVTPVQVQLQPSLDGSLTAEVHLCKAALLNRRVHQVSTGIHTVFDDDGATPLVTLTPTDDGDDHIAVEPT